MWWRSCSIGMRVGRSWCCLPAWGWIRRRSASTWPRPRRRASGPVMGWCWARPPAWSRRPGRRTPAPRMPATGPGSPAGVTGAAERAAGDPGHPGGLPDRRGHRPGRAGLRPGHAGPVGGRGQLHPPPGRPPRPRGALVTADLRAILAGLPRTGWPGVVAARRDAALLVLGFAGAFRRAELAGLDVSDVRAHPTDGLHVMVRAAKNDPGHLGAVGDGLD